MGLRGRKIAESETEGGEQARGGPRGRGENRGLKFEKGILERRDGERKGGGAQGGGESEDDLINWEGVGADLWTRIARGRNKGWGGRGGQRL